MKILNVNLHKSNVMVKCLAIMLFVLQVLVSNLDPMTCYPKRFVRGFLSPFRQIQG
jgi:hypothetical protein